jgi:LysM repeat protein
MATRGGLSSVSWPSVAAVALLAGLVVAGWNYWGIQTGPPSAVPAVAPSAHPEPGAASVASAADRPAPAVTRARSKVASTPSPTGTSSPAPSPTPLLHEMQSGETVYYIASYYGISPDAILEANGLDENSARRLRSGQKLVIPSPGPLGGGIPGPTVPAPQIIHEVKSGEAIITIADAYGTTVEAIMAANNFDSPDLIYAGQHIIVPLMPPTATPTLTPTPTPSSTPGPPFVAPDLLSPPVGSVFRGTDAGVLLSWTSVGILQESQSYLVEVEIPARSAPITYTTQGTTWRLPPDLWPTGRRRGLSWRVTVVEQAGPGSSGPGWRPVSLPSETRRFVWQ